MASPIQDIAKVPNWLKRLILYEYIQDQVIAVVNLRDSVNHGFAVRILVEYHPTGINGEAEISSMVEELIEVFLGNHQIDVFCESWVSVEPDCQASADGIIKSYIIERSHEAT